MNKQYAVLIADIKSSRLFKSNDRFKVQNKLFKTTEILNSVFSEVLSSPISFSAGDSIQGLFENFSAALRCYFLLRELFLPNIIRGGIGIGEINTKIFKESNIYFNGGNTNYIDGDAYHFAKNALDEAKLRNTDVLVFSNKKWDDSIVNNSLLIASSLRKKATHSQMELLRICEFIYPLLNESELEILKQNYTQCADLLELDEKFYSLYMDKTDFYRELLNVSNYISPYNFDKNNNNSCESVFEADITSRNLDAYLAKIFDVSSQNIWLLRKRGSLKDIRTQEKLALLCLERNYYE